MNSGMYAADIKALASAHTCAQTLASPDRQVSVDNPFCGDRVDLQIQLAAGRITAIAQQVRGCMLCQASANALAQFATGLSKEDIEAIANSLTAMLKRDEHSGFPPAGWEVLALFEPVQRHKSRHGCVTLPFTALLRALL